MSEATKSAALAHAISIFLPGSEETDPAAILKVAAQFDAFLTGSDVKASPATKAVAALTGKTPGKKKAPPVVEDEDEDEETEEADDETETEDEDEGVTKEQAGAAIAALIDNDQRDEAVAILAKYKAKSLKGLAPEHYEAVKKLAEKKLTIE